MKLRFLIIFAILIPLAGCTECMSCNEIKTGASTKAEMEETEKNHDKLRKAVPTPSLDDSLERRNLVKRLELFNDPNKTSYIYLINYGKVMSFHVIKGKVTYASSKLTTRDQIITVRQTGERDTHVVESPGLDGSYGPSEDAIFFWTTDGTYVEWKGDYMLCDQPLKLTTPPQLVREIK
jgi:hypothetical protein